MGNPLDEIAGSPESSEGVPEMPVQLDADSFELLEKIAGFAERQAIAAEKLLELNERLLSAIEKLLPS